MAVATLQPLDEAATAGMVDPHHTRQLGPYLREVWRRRSYMRYVAESDLRSRQVDTVLGNLWHLLNPALLIAIYYLIFGLLLKTDRGVDNFILFLSVGVFTFGFSQRAVTTGAGSVVGNLGIMRAIHFPRAVLPITSTITEAMTSLSSVVVMLGVAVVTDQMPTWRWLVFPGVLTGQFVLGLGGAMIAARLTVHVRDTAQILPFVFRLLFYGSGVIFNVSSYASGSHEMWFTLNPLYCYLTISRWCIMGTEASLELVISAAVWSLALLVAGFLWFKAGEEDYARE